MHTHTHMGTHMGAQQPLASCIESGPLGSCCPTRVCPFFCLGRSHACLHPPAPARSAELKWGSSSSKLSLTAKGSSSYYTQDYYFNPALNISGLTDAQFNYTSGSLHTVRLSGLKPGERYYYCLSESLLLPEACRRSAGSIFMPALSMQRSSVGLPVQACTRS